MNSSLGMTGELEAEVIRHKTPAGIKEYRLPFGWGRVGFTKDIGVAGMFGQSRFETNLQALHFNSKGKVIKDYNLGSGLVTNVGVQCMANDPNWAAPSGTPNGTLAICQWMGVGTSSTAATVNDLYLNAPAAPTTSSYVAATSQTLLSAASVQILRTTGTVNFTGSLAITEWGLFSAQSASVTTGTPFTATSGTSGTATGTPYTASSTTARGEEALIVQNLTTGVYGLITSNSTSVLNIPAWYNISNGGAGSTPGNTAFSILPVMWDHKVFSVINVNNGDSIQFTYSLTINSGG